MKVALVSPPFVKEYMRNARCDFVSLSGTQWFPIWLGYCGCLLEKYGHTVKLIDAPAYGMSKSRVFRILEEFKPDFLVVYSSTMSKFSDINFTDFLVNKLKIPAVFVGPYVSINPADYLIKSAKVSYVIYGEFDYPVLELIRGDAPEKIKNLIYKKNNKIIKNPARPYLEGKDLDAFPFVSEFFIRHLDFKYYRTPSELHPFIDIMTGRGCCYSFCTFCLWVHTFIKGKRYAKRSYKNLEEEIKFIARTGKVKSIMFQDDTLEQERAIEVSEIILKNNIKIKWSCYARANLSYDTLKLMKKAGCRNLHVGYESANPEVLKLTRKGLTVKRMTKFTYDAKKAGLRIHGDFLIGLPGETREGILKTIEWAKQLDPHTAQFQLFIPYEGTPVYFYLKENNFLKPDGRPEYPWLSEEEMRELAKKAYRQFYFRWQYFKRVLLHPYDHLFLRMKTIIRAIPAMFWQRWQV